MGIRSSKSEDKNNYINQINNINEDELDLSNIDRLQIKSIKRNEFRIKRFER